jgi:hypothetical protein
MNSSLSLPSRSIKHARIRNVHQNKGIPKAKVTATKVRRLSPVIKDDGFTLELLSSVGNVAIYRKFKSAYEAGYEVIRIRTVRATMVRGKHYPKRQVYPTSAQWGVLGFTYRALKDALGKMNSLRGVSKAKGN